MNKKMSERTVSQNATGRQRLLELAVISVAVFAAGYIGSMATIPNIPVWYEALNKPFFNPPNWVFGPVWTVLYLLMIASCWRVLDKARGTPRAKTIISIFALQLFFNALWPIVFFGLHETGLAILVVIALDLSVYATIAIFLKVDRLAGLALIPYAAWVSFASAINIAVYWLNRAV
jgi:benzodiazapine receptor